MTMTKFFPFVESNVPISKIFHIPVNQNITVFNNHEYHQLIVDNGTHLQIAYILTYHVTVNHNISIR